MRRLLMMFIFLCSSDLKEGQTAACSNTYFGHHDPNAKDNHIDNNVGYGYLIDEVDYRIDCCGIVDGWEVDVEVSGSRTLTLQVWRPVSGNTYELVGENSFTTASDGEQPKTVAANFQITVKSGDRFGWWTSGSDMVRYKSGGGEKDDTKQLSMSDLSTGATQDWSSATNRNDRTYAIRMDVNANSAPSFTNLGGSTSILNTVASGTSIYTVTATDSNPYDVSSLTVSMAANSKFNFDPSTKIISTGTLGSSSTETLTFTVTDQCSNTATGTYTVTVTNNPPTITSLPATETISESLTAQTSVHAVVVSDDPGETITCTVTSPASSTFFLNPADATVYLSSNAGLDYDVQSSYSLTIQCSDGDGSDTDTLTINLIRNPSPVIVNLQNSTSVSTTTTIGTNVFTVISTDDDALYYNMTCDPVSCPFSIFDSGAIQLNADLTGHSVVGYDLYIYVYDGRTLVGPGLLTVTITDINDPVLISNLPLGSALTVPENSALGLSVYAVSVSDNDADTHTFTMTSSPASGLTYFSISPTSGLISTSSSNNINFEALTPSTTFDLTVTVSDGTASDTQVLQIEISNLNEAPSFNQASYSSSSPEGPAGTALTDPSFAVTDQDSGDTTTFTFDCGGTSTGYFLMATNDGTLTFSSDYDLDTGSRPTSVTCAVTVIDSGGATDTCTLTITITDLNDNVPVFSPTTYSFFESYYAAVGTTVGTVTATDADAGAFGVITYSLDQVSLGNAYFGVTTGGAIYTLQSLTPLGSSVSVTIVATATDSGGLNDNATVVIVISDVTTTTTTTYTDRFKTFFEDGGNVAWVIACGLVILMILCLAIWFFCISDGAKGLGRVWNKRRRCCKKSKRGHRRGRRYSVDPRRHRRGSWSPETPDSPRRNRRRERSPRYAETGLSSVRQPPPPISEQAWRIEM